MMAASRKVERPGLPPEPFDNHSLNVIDFATAQHPRKALARLKAQFAQVGHQVYDGGNDDFIVTRWGMSRYCPDLTALRTFARVLGVTR